MRVKVENLKDGVVSVLIGFLIPGKVKTYSTPAGPATLLKALRIRSV